MTVSIDRGRPGDRDDRDDRRELATTARALARKRGHAAELERTFETTRIPMVWMDSDRRYVEGNAAACLFFRRTNTELRGTRIQAFTPPAHVAEQDEIWSDLMSAGTVAGSSVLQTPDGATVALDYCAVANLLPGRHLTVWLPTDWHAEDLGPVVVQDPAGIEEISDGQTTTNHRVGSEAAGVHELQVIVLERQPAVRLGLGLVLQTSGLRVVGTARTADEAERMILARQPHVALLDDVSALDTPIARNVLARWDGARLLAYVNGALEPAAIEDGFDAGLAGFASRAAEPTELVAAIRTVAAGAPYLDPRLRADGSDRLAETRLTYRQREILELLAAGMTSEQAARELVVSKQTIDTHVRNLMARLGARTRTHAVALALAHDEIQLPQAC
jgi:DNA-binding NarL/FixJ family response regulator